MRNRMRKLRTGYFCIVLCALLFHVAPGWAQDRTDSFFDQYDQNEDGKLSKQELPESMRRAFGREDANSDGYISKDEDRRFRQRQTQQKRSRTPLPKPAHANAKYGPHERNRLDIWPAKSDKPTPLVIYYHGGGFRGGDKKTLNPKLLDLLLKEGITVAAANYRLSNVAPLSGTDA